MTSLTLYKKTKEFISGHTTYFFLLGIFAALTMFAVSFYGINQALADDFCAFYPEDPSCSTDFCTQYPSDPSCQTSACDIDPFSPECFAEYCQEHPEDPDCDNDPCLDPWNTDPSCQDPCESAEPPPECTETQYYCEGSGFCQGGTTSACNADFSHIGEPGWEADDSLCNCDCYTNEKFCNTEGACNYDPGKAGLAGWEADDSVCSWEGYCPDPNDPFYTDPATLLCPKPNSGYCRGIPVCNNAAFCDGAPACNYDPELASSEGYYSSDDECYCQGYCPDEDDPNYVDPTSLNCPEADNDLCSDTTGCMDEEAANYDADATQHDQSMCLYMNQSICEYQATFEVIKENPGTGNLRRYDVGIIQLYIITVFTDTKNTPPACPETIELDLEEYAAFIYDSIYPSWPNFWSNLTYYRNLGESEDLCSNIEGMQETVPPGYVRSGNSCIEENECVDQGCTVDEENGECDCIDMCPNISGIQEEVPTGYYLDGDNNCITGEECEDAGGQIINGICQLPVNGVCADYSPDPSGGEPTGTLCTAGNATDPGLFNNVWEWECQGQYGGSDAQCSVNALCGDDEIYCSTNAPEDQCIDSLSCCDGFMKCGSRCVPYNPAGCDNDNIVCDASTEPPLCTADGTVILSQRVSPPVADIDTNVCGLSWTADIDEEEAEDAEVACTVVQNGAEIGTYGPAGDDTSYARDISPGEYTISCVRESELEGVDEEGQSIIYILREEDNEVVKCAKNPNFIEF